MKTVLDYIIEGTQRSIAQLNRAQNYWNKKEKQHAYKNLVSNDEKSADKELQKWYNKYYNILSTDILIKLLQSKIQDAEDY